MVLIGDHVNMIGVWSFYLDISMIPYDMGLNMPSSCELRPRVETSGAVKNMQEFYFYNF